MQDNKTTSSPSNQNQGISPQTIHQIPPRPKFVFKDNLNVPNLLTLLRIAAIPWVIILLYDPQSLNQHVWAGCLFGVALITDMFDGIIARRYKLITPLGQIMDPVADKLMIIAGLIMILHLEYIDPLWVLILIGREVVVTSLRSLASQYGATIPSITSARMKVFAEGFGIGILMGGPEFQWLGVPWYELGHISIIVAVILALWSAGIYFTHFYQHIKHQPPTT